MKKETFLSLFLIVFSYNLQAQITLTQADMPQIGDEQITITANVTPGISIGSPGVNQTYDFSDLEGIDTSSISFISPAGTPGESSFPSATLAALFDGNYSYLEISSSAALFLGSSADTSSNGSGQYYDLVFNPSELFFQLPTTYGTNYLDESGFSITADGGGMGFDSIRLTTRSLKNADFDGWGTVITPNGAFDGLREQSIVTSFDTTEIYAFGMWQVFLTNMSIDTSYHWYSQDSKGFLVSVDIQDGTVSYADYQDLEATIDIPTAAFSYTDQGVGVVDFIDLSSNQPTSWMWDFGDTNSSSLQNPTHTYASEGMYEVCLTATNSAGSTTSCQMLDIQIAVVPVASFTYSDQGQGTVDFLDQSTNQPTSWMWDFGDTNTSTMQNPSYTFAASGMYNVCLTATNIAGSDTNCQMLDIEVVVAPVAAFSYEQVLGGVFNFTDESLNQPTAWEWDFGDGNTSNMQNPSNTYFNNGLYDVCLIATNIGGADTTCQTLDIMIASIDILTSDLKVELFPNPASDWLSLKLESDKIRTVDFILFNVLGQPVLNQQVETVGQFIFDIKNLSTGTFHFLLRNKQGQDLAKGSLLKN